MMDLACELMLPMGLLPLPPIFPDRNDFSVKANKMSSSTRGTWLSVHMKLLKPHVPVLESTRSLINLS